MAFYTGFPKKKQPKAKGVKIDFTFQGYITGARIKRVTEVLKKAPFVRVISTQGMSANKLMKGLASGKYTITLGDYLYENSDDQEIEIGDFQESIE